MSKRQTPQVIPLRRQTSKDVIESKLSAPHLKQTLKVSFLVYYSRYVARNQCFEVVRGKSETWEHSKLHTFDVKRLSAAFCIDRAQRVFLEIETHEV